MFDLGRSSRLERRVGELNESFRRETDPRTWSRANPMIQEVFMHRNIMPSYRSTLVDWVHQLQPDAGLYDLVTGRRLNTLLAQC